MTLRATLICLFCLSLPAAAQDDPSADDFIAALTALEEPPPLICASGMIAAAEMAGADPAAAAAEAGALRAEIGAKPPYAAPFDAAAAEDVAGMIGTALEAAASAPLETKYGGMDAATVQAEFSAALGDLGLSADSAIDVTAVYLAFVWSAQERDFSALLSNKTIMAVRDQVMLAEARCFQLGKLGDDLAGVRNLMIIRAGFLVDGLEGTSRSGYADAFGDFVRESSGRQIEGLRLMPGGFTAAD